MPAKLADIRYSVRRGRRIKCACLDMNKCPNVEIVLHTRVCEFDLALLRLRP